MQGAAGTVSVSVDLSRPTLWGPKAKQHTALQDYPEEADAANQRAHGGATLLGQFKAAFSQLNSSYPGLSQQSPQAPAALGAPRRGAQHPRRVGAVRAG